jgi:hypothetical protein
MTWLCGESILLLLLLGPGGGKTLLRDNVVHLLPLLEGTTVGTDLEKEERSRVKK